MVTIADNRSQHKDAGLIELARLGHNVAQFISWSPGGDQRHSAVRGYEVDAPIDGGVADLLERTGSVNLRTWFEDSQAGCPFVYGINGRDHAERRIRDLRRRGYYVIANETIDVHDGGVSGVTHGPLMEFAPGDTPRCVEQADVARMPAYIGQSMLGTIYGVAPYKCDDGARWEWSIHPTVVGYRSQRCVVWQRTEAAPPPAGALVSWPNRFSRFVGDKAYGLMVAHELGCSVPSTVVVTRRGLTFRFGDRVDRGRDIRYWFRTCPAERDPGHHPTWRGYGEDPLELIGGLGPDVASLLIQAPVPAAYSGAASWQKDGDVVIEGVEGEGERYMLGLDAPSALPAMVTERIGSMIRWRLRPSLPSGEIEWVIPETRSWPVVVQLHAHCPDPMHRSDVCESWKRVDPQGGVRAVRSAAEAAQREGVGVALSRPVGLTSHVAQVLDRAGVPWGVWRRDRVQEGCEVL